MYIKLESQLIAKLSQVIFQQKRPSKNNSFSISFQEIFIRLKIYWFIFFGIKIIFGTVKSLLRTSAGSRTGSWETLVYIVNVYGLNAGKLTLLRFNK
jgi:hypothetical protein